MPIREDIDIHDLKLDLRNFRTLPQENEVQAIRAMIFISPDRFWALMESIIDNNYLPTDNILVLDNGSERVVREGNRRIAAIKLIYGYIPGNTVSIPSHLTTKIAGLSDDWKNTNKKVPCTIYDMSEEAIVDRIVTLTHGKGEKAGRDQWPAVARARHNRNVQKANEPALDLLEAYLGRAKNFTQDQAERWAGTYPLSVLEDAMKRLSPRLGVANSTELARKYPHISYCDALDEVIKAIGGEAIVFKTLRSTAKDFAVPYGIPLLPYTSQQSSEDQDSTTNHDPTKDTNVSTDSNPTTNNKTDEGRSVDDKPTSSNNTKSSDNDVSINTDSPKVNAVSTRDPRAVKRMLRNFKPKGNNRRKVVELRDEARYINIEHSPLAFCFLLRSMFEVSAKAFCEDHAHIPDGPKAMKATGEDRRLVEVLKDIYNYLTKPNTPGGKPDQATKKLLHGAIVELAREDGILSVTSLNQLIHSPNFSTTEKDICVLFGNIFPFLEIING